MILRFFFFSLNFTKYMIFDGRKGAVLFFISECLFGGTINAQFQSLFC